MKYWIPPTTWNAGVTINMVGDGLTGGYLPQPSVNGVLDLTPQQAGALSNHPLIVPKPTHYDYINSLSPYSNIPMDEPSGGIWDHVLDLQLARSGASAGLVYRSPSLLPNGEGYSILLPGGSANYFTAPDTTSYDVGFAPAWSMSAWIIQTVVPVGNVYAISKRATTATTTDGDFDFIFSSTTQVSGRRFTTTPTTLTFNYGTTAQMTASPHHVFFTSYWTGTVYTTEAWMDGSLITTSNSVQPTTPSPNAFRIGAIPGTASAGMACSLQNFAMWFRRLTLTEIQGLYRTGL